MIIFNRGQIWYQFGCLEEMYYIFPKGSDVAKEVEQWLSNQQHNKYGK